MVQRQCNLGNKREDEEEGFYWLMRLRLTQQINLLELGRFRRKKAERWLKGSSLDRKKQEVTAGRRG